MTGTAKWQARLAQASRDLEELERQILDGEIPPDSADRLRRTYLREIEEAREEISRSGTSVHTPAPPQASRDAPTGFWSRGRVIVVALLGVAAIALVVSVGWFVEPRDQPGGEDDAFDPSLYSNETMEAVITANAEHPQINGMRLALARRYFQAGDFSGAFGHYREVLEREPTAGEAAEALSRLGWMAWAGSGEVPLAIETLDRALAAVPDHPQALYFKAIVLWCGADQPGEAVSLLERVLESMPDETGVASELDAARSGERCQ